MGMGMGATFMGAMGATFTIAPLLGGCHVPYCYIVTISPNEWVPRTELLNSEYPDKSIIRFVELVKYHGEEPGISPLIMGATFTITQLFMGGTL